MTNQLLAELEVKDKEIIKLVDELEEQERHIKEADFEIERLNNIINELEKWLEDVYYGRGNCHMDSAVIGIKSVLNKIQELKGDKE